MIPQYKPLSAQAEPKAGAYPTISVLSKSLVASSVLVTILLGGLTLTGGIQTLMPGHHGDDVTPAEAEQRLAAFSSHAPVVLTLVQDRDLLQAIESMTLRSDQKEQLLTELSPQPSRLPDAQAPDPARAPEAAPSRRPMRLAWISLWDTDVEDGDIVRIDSQGYSRTVTLKKQPMTFAVPVPADGIVTVTGVNDGDGGGITVGLASGASQAIFPIMSPGQQLGLKVTVN